MVRVAISRRATPDVEGGGGATMNQHAAGIRTHVTTFGVAVTTIRQCRAMVARDLGLDIGVVEA